MREVKSLEEKSPLQIPVKHKGGEIVLLLRFKQSSENLPPIFMLSRHV